MVCHARCSNYVMGRLGPLAVRMRDAGNKRWSFAGSEEPSPCAGGTPDIEKLAEQAERRLAVRERSRSAQSRLVRRLEHGHFERGGCG